MFDRPEPLTEQSEDIGITDIPMLKKMLTEARVGALQSIVTQALDDRFPPLPADVSAAIRLVDDEDRLQALIDAAYTADSLAAFRTHLTTPAS